MTQGVLYKRYEKLSSERSQFLEDAYKSSELTIQFLLPRLGEGKGQNSPPSIIKQHQSIGAMGVNNISNKLLLALFPPNQSFFKLGIDDFTALELAGDDQARSKIEEGFSAVERTATDFTERSGLRPPFEEALKHLIVTGNILINRTKTGGLEIFHMDQYVLSRDPDGKVREIVIDEKFTFASLPDRVKDIMRAEGKEPAEFNEQGEPNDNYLSMYTQVRKINDKIWKVTQEVEGIPIPTQGPNTFKDEKNPWFALRFHAIKGSSWGRGYIHNFLGDLDTLEQLWKSLTHGAKAMAFLLFMIRPGSTIRPKDIIEKVNGGFVSANPDDVGVLQSQKAGDYTTVLNAIDRITGRLSKALLMDESITRAAERVTATEIRVLAQRLEESLGGFYSILTQDFQLPYLQLTLDHMIKTKQIPNLPKGVVKPIIITGLDALGRNSEAERLSQFTQELQAAMGPELVGQILNPLDMAKRLGAARGIDTKGLIKSQEDMDAEKQQAQQQAQAEAVGPAAAGLAGKIAPTEVGQEVLSNMVDGQGQQ
jgi:hypothetical protein